MTTRIVAGFLVATLGCWAGFTQAISGQTATGQRSGQTAETAFGRKRAGMVTRAIQPATLQRPQAPNEGPVPATDKLPIFSGDVLITGAGGRMRATLEDGSVLHIGPESSLVVRQVDTLAQQSEFDLRYGRIRAQVARLTLPDSKFEIRTNVAVVTVLEGGDVYVDATSPVGTAVMCSSGKVDVQGTAIPISELNKHVVLNAGEATTVTASGSENKLERHPASAEELSMARATSDAFGTGAFRIGNGVTAPQLVYRVEPEYPEEARKAGIEGTVVLYAVVNPDGMIRNVRVIRSLDPVLDENAMKAVRQWKFKPGMKDGKPVPVAASIEVTFRLLDHPGIGQKKH
jgi:TonB family protein